MNKTDFILRWVIVLSVSGLISSCHNSGTNDNLKQGFLNPPDSAKPGVYWYFMGGNLDREAMTADLESMKKAGIGYVLFLEVNVGIPRGKVDFLSEEWQELYKHAVKEAERLGIRVILGSGPGWAGVLPYDMNPASDLDLGSVADVPMGEFWSDGYGFNSAFSCIEATSIAHVAGLPVVAAEGYHKYISRCQYILSRGIAVADILYITPVLQSTRNLLICLNIQK